MRLDFRIDLRLDRKNVMAQFDYFPPELVSRAGALGLGLELSVYPADLEELARARDARRGGTASRAASVWSQTAGFSKNWREARRFAAV